MGADVGNASQLQQTLDGTVLAVLTVHDGEDHVDALADNAVALEAQQTLAADGRDGAAAVGGVVQPGTGGQLGVVGAAEDDPIAILGDADGIDVILLVVDVVQNGLGRTQGDLVLGADAAEQNTNTEFLQNKQPLSRNIFGY